MKTRVTPLAYRFAAFAFFLIGISCSNDKTKSTETSNEPPVTVSAVKLLADFEKDPAAADKLYKGKTVIVSGEVMDMQVNHDSTSYVLLNSPESSMGSVQCLFDADKVASTSKLQREQQTTITGVCDGMDDVQVTVVVKNSSIN
jgi:hypothetical protein